MRFIIFILLFSSCAKAQENFTLYVGKPSSYETEAQAYFTAVESAGGTLTTAQKTSWNTHVITLKAEGIYTKLKFYFPFKGGTAAANAIDAISATSLITWSGTVIHNGSGVKGDGSTGYGAANINFASLIGTPQDAHFGFYSRTSLAENNGSSNAVEFGNGNASGNQQAKLAASASYYLTGAMGNGFVQATFGGSGVIDETTGHVLVSRRSSTDMEVYRNAVSKATQTSVDAAAFLTTNPYILALNNDGTPFGYSNRQLSALHGGTSLSDAEALILYEEIERDQEANNRNVINYDVFLANANATSEPLDGVGVGVIGSDLFIWGGWNGNVTPPDRNTQYSSPDGSTWTAESNAAWAEMHSFGLDKTANGRYWKIGGDAISTTTAAERGELWYTDNGTTWTLAKSGLTFMEDRVLFGFVIDDNDDFYIVGGHQVTGTFPSWTLSASNLYTDVWKSTDLGQNWTQIATGQTQLGGNLNGQTIWYDGAIHVVCAPSKYDDSNGNRTFNKEHWKSTDGITWTQLTDFYGTGRQYGNLATWDNKLWLINGYNGGGGGTNYDQLWYYNGNDWGMIQERALYNTHATGVIEFLDKLYILNGNLNSAAWYIDKIN